MTEDIRNGLALGLFDDAYDEHVTVAGSPRRTKALDVADGDFLSACAGNHSDGQAHQFEPERISAGNDAGLADATALIAAIMKPDIQWGEPVDFLGDGLLGEPVLSEKHVPPALWPFIKDSAERMGVDPSAIAFIALAVCSSVTSDNWMLQPKRNDNTWTEQPRLWAAIVGDPSVLKTPILSICTAPINQLESNARKRHCQIMADWREACAAAKRDKRQPPKEPKCDRHMVESITPEALTEVLRDDDDARFSAPAGKVLSRQDELSEWIAGLDRYAPSGKNGFERGHYLRSYNGGPFTADRISRGAISISNWSISVIGGIQPEPIRRIARDATEDGLIQRFMSCVPGEPRVGQDRVPDANAIAGYNDLIVSLSTLQPHHASASCHFDAVVLHDDAHVHREEVNELASALGAMPDTSSRMKATLGKWPGLFARLCLTFYLIEIADTLKYEIAPVCGVVSAEIAARVSAFMLDILLPHTIRAEAVMFSTNQAGHARWIAGYILSNKLPKISLRDIVRAYGPLRAPEDRPVISSVMAALNAVGWVESEDPANPSKGVTNWTVNPRVHTLFADRAEAEKARRLAAQERIAKAVKRLRGGSTIPSYRMCK